MTARDDREVVPLDEEVTFSVLSSRAAEKLKLDKPEGLDEKTEDCVGCDLLSSIIVDAWRGGLLDELEFFGCVSRTAAPARSSGDQGEVWTVRRR
ncbi:hypothetical protein [Propionivibrio soli]|uniref:hypothetical protein n=1 Tax=Propionivibrio soli TaxID=2976531 RepID=UPI0021E8268D|nr:hypothetical protein [Propionivibrio soli]